MDERFGHFSSAWGSRNSATSLPPRPPAPGSPPPLLWTTSPEHVHLLDRLDYDGLIYDCDREWDDASLAWEARWPARPMWCLPPLPT